MTGGPDKSSIRAGFGLFYTAIEDLTQFQEGGDPPYGLVWGSPVPSFFESQGPSRRAGDAKIPVLCSAHQCFGQESFYWFSVVTGGANLSWVASNKNYSLPDGEHYELSLQRENWCRHDRDRELRGTQGQKLLTFVEPIR